MASTRFGRCPGALGIERLVGLGTDIELREETVPGELEVDVVLLDEEVETADSGRAVIALARSVSTTDSLER